MSSTVEALAATPAGETPLLLRALRSEPVPRPPVWMMRQAGRYLPEYMAVRSKLSFLELCHDADLCCEVTLQPLRRFAFDAGIIFSDILLPLEAMGCALSFGKGHGPKFAEPLRSRSAIDALRSIDPWRDLPSPCAPFSSPTPAPVCRSSASPARPSPWLATSSKGRAAKSGPRPSR